MTKVLVTGASGFIAKHILGELIAKEYQIRASVRNDQKRNEIEMLYTTAPIEYVTLDLNVDTGWAEALEGVDVLIHTASPFPLAEPKDRESLIRPAVDGTLRALNAAKTAGVQRVILTSSCAAIYKDASKPINAVSTEENWTTISDPSVGAYEASKTLAERAAWDFVAQNPETNLTVINPSAVLGAPKDDQYGASLELVERVLSAKDPVQVDLDMPMVDVRDVAMMHVAAIDNPETFGQRIAANAGARNLVDVAKKLAETYPERGIKTKVAPKWLLSLMSYFNAEVKQVVPNLGRNLDVDNTKAKTIFDFEFIAPEISISESAEYLAAQGK